MKFGQTVLDFARLMPINNIEFIERLYYTNLFKSFQIISNSY